MGLNLVAADIGKHYNGKPVLQGCSYTFDAGVHVLMGPNGSGKSTFLRICALLEPPDAGEIIYRTGGNALPHDAELMRRITLLLPKTGLFNTTVSGNVAYGLRIRGVEKSEILSRVERMLDFVHLSGRQDQNALTLSSGETQRLGIARALAIGPEVLFLDEPTASVDEENREIVENIILKMKRENGPVIVMTTHDRAQAERLADRILIMKDGKLGETGNK